MLFLLRTRRIIGFLSACLVFLVCFNLIPADANTRADELRAQIQNRQSEIEAVEREIAQFQKDIEKTGKESKTLQQAIKTLDLTQKKLDADIVLTEKKIDSEVLTIERLQIEIGGKQSVIAMNKDALHETLRALEATGEYTPLELMLSDGTFSDFWDRMYSLDQVDHALQRSVSILKVEKEGLETRRDEAARVKANLLSLRAQLADQKKIAKETQSSKAKLLTQTKNKEANYKKLLAENLARRDAFEKELLSFESQLRITLDQSLLPPAGSGVLLWPLDSVLITQKFGHTEFSKSSAGSVYNGQGHNGVDFRASEGTPVRSAQSGVVLGAGDTDVTCQGASYGKWVLVKHNNGLTTLYAHLSLIKVEEGQTVGARDVIGYSGNTGYSTGPHLHFSVYASQGVSVGSLKSKVPGCGTYRIPRAALNSYLNPLTYL